MPTVEEGAEEHLKQLGQDFNSWSEILTSHSTQACYALIAANWAVYGQLSKILQNSFAKWSVIFSVGSIGVNLLVNWLMTTMHFARYAYAESSKSRWETEYSGYLVKRSQNDGRVPWPYTPGIENLGKVSRFTKMIIPVIAATVFIISLFKN